jgi:hypothetical protein
MNKYDEYIFSDNQFQQSSFSWLSTLRKETILIMYANTAIGLAGAKLAIHDNLGWYCDVAAHSFAQTNSNRLLK